MKKALLLAVFAAFLTLAGCEEHEHGHYTINFFSFENKTRVAVTIEGYADGKRAVKWSVEPGKSLEQYQGGSYYSSHYGWYSGYGGYGGEYASGYASVFDYDTVRVVFGDTKELWCKANDLASSFNIFNLRNYEQGNLENFWTYEITDATMSAATQIAPAQ